MATNFVRTGEQLKLTAPSGGVSSGDPFVSGNFFGVALADAAEAAEVMTALDGVWTLPKTTSQSWAEGDRLYWDGGTGKITNVAGALTPVGIAVRIEASNATTGQVKLVPGYRVLSGISAVTQLTDNSGGATADGTIGVITAPSALTDSTGGTASTTLAAIDNALTGVDGTGSNAAPLAGVNTQLGVLRNAIASLAARQAEDRTAIIAATDAVKEVATKLNAVIAAA